MTNQAPARYTVQSGDTLYGIAASVYGDGEKYLLIQQANQLADANLIQVGQVLIIPALGGAGEVASAPPDVITAPVTPETDQPSTPDQVAAGAPIPGAVYGTLSINSAPSDRPAAEHGDINLALRGFEPTQSTLGLIEMNGPTDGRAPQLFGLFADRRLPQVSNVYRAHNWDWPRNGRGELLSKFDVTVIGLRTEAGETVHVPGAGYDIGDGYQVLVLYATSERLTLKYTREDNVVRGYTIHVENVHAEPSLLALYAQMNSAGRGQLPAIRAGQALGRAHDAEIQVAIRDNGRFLDPRVRKDWWHG